MIESLLALVIVVPVMFAILAVALPLEALAAWKLWGWFAVPLGAQHVGFWGALGVVLLVRSLCVQAPSDDRKVKWGTVFARMILAPLFAVLVGWFVHLLATP